MDLNPPLLVCSAIIVDAPNTKLTSPTIRVNLLIEALINWRKLQPTLNIVLCDGSGYDLSLALKANGLGDESITETLFFYSDTQRVRERGKGFGEGQIIEHAINTSKIIKNAGGFMKCTAKLWVPNFSICLKTFNGLAGFDYQGRSKPILIDTRFYIVGTTFYRSHLCNAYQEVDERRGLYIEHVYKNRLTKLSPHEYLLRVTPLIYGVSGSTGATYRPSRVRNIAKSIRNSFVCATGKFP